MIITISNDLAEDVKYLWDKKWRENPVNNIKLLISIANKLLAAINLAESQARTGHVYKLERSPLDDIRLSDGS